MSLCCPGGIQKEKSREQLDKLSREPRIHHRDGGQSQGIVWMRTLSGLCEV
jgi:hypothetical protein